MVAEEHHHKQRKLLPVVREQKRIFKSEGEDITITVLIEQGEIKMLQGAFVTITQNLQ